MAKSPSNPSPDPTKKPPGRAQIPEKCRKCAMLTMPDVYALHGTEGDGCYNPKVCRSRRSHARKAEQNNYNRRLQHKMQRQGGESTSKLVVPTDVHPPLSVQLPPAVADRTYAMLLLYREPGYRGRVHAIRAQVWQGSRLVNEIAGEHCIGMIPTEVTQYVSAMLDLLKQIYGIQSFADIVQLDPDYCPIRPCPRHSALLSQIHR